MFALGGGMLAGAWLCLRLPVLMPGWLLVLAAAGALVAWRRGCPGVAGCGAGMALAGASLALALADRLDPALERESIELVGIIADWPVTEPRRVVLTVRVETPAALPTRVRLSWYEPGSVPRPGERWRFEARLQRPRGLVNTGSGSREAWLLRQRIGATGHASGPAAAERLTATGDRWLVLRGQAAVRVEAAVPEARAAAVLKAITLGFRGGLDAPTRAALAATGTGHLLAISGLHVGLVAAFGAAAGGLLGRSFGGTRRPVRDWAALGALVAAGTYCALAGMPVSARRATLMTAVGLAALLLRRGGSVLAALGAALALVLLLDPLAVLDPGLWLSFGAVATLIAVIAGRRAAAGKLSALLRIQAALAVGMLALTVVWFGRVSLVAPLANLLAVPWFSLFVVPPALAGVGLSWLWPALGALPLKWAGIATEWALWVIERLAAWPWSARAVAAPGPLALLLAGVGAAWCLLPRPAPGRLLAPLLFAPLWLGAAPPLAPGAFELRVFDVGHGLAVLVRTRSRALLYDTGPSWPGGTAAEWTVVPALAALGVRHLDALMVSHGHADHMGGAPSVRTALPVAREWAGFGAEHVANQACRTGSSWAWDGVRFSVLHPADTFRGGVNDGSCVLLVAGPGGRALLTGDIESRGERAVLAAHGRLPVDLLVAPHHGSRTSSGAPFVAATRPAWVVFSTNWRNRWGFPAEAVVARWQAAGAQPLSTERHGEILIRFEPAGPRPPRWRRAEECRPWLDCG